VPTTYALEFEDTFDGTTLDTERWLPHHLPQWSSRDQAAARYQLGDGRLTLRVDADQPPWCPEFDGTTRVSSLQTGVSSGPTGSRLGQHRFSDAATVREAQQTLRLFTPQYGLFELRAAVSLDAVSMAALWMIGFEDEPHHSAEICICEIFGRDVDPASAAIGMGVHPFGDPTIVDEFSAVRVPIDVREFHVYAAEWTPSQVVFSVDGTSVQTVAQSPSYPMQFMLGIYDFTEPATIRPDAYPKQFVIDYFRAYRRMETSRS
jgi:Glycosyl hydrolases family 16